jgi:hypothetical protein
MNEKTIGFIRLLDAAINIAKRRKSLRDAGAPDSAPVGALENIIEALTRYKDSALAGTLQPSDGVATTGLLREVADWSEPSESELFQAVRAIERYYLANI